MGICVYLEELTAEEKENSLALSLSLFVLQGSPATSEVDYHNAPVKDAHSLGPLFSPGSFLVPSSAVVILYPNQLPRNSCTPTGIKHQNQLP